MSSSLYKYSWIGSDPTVSYHLTHITSSSIIPSLYIDAYNFAIIQQAIKPCRTNLQHAVTQNRTHKLRYDVDCSLGDGLLPENNRSHSDRWINVGLTDVADALKGRSSSDFLLASYSCPSLNITPTFADKSQLTGLSRVKLRYFLIKFSRTRR